MYSRSLELLKIERWISFARKSIFILLKTGTFRSKDLMIIYWFEYLQILNNFEYKIENSQELWKNIRN